MAEKRIRTWVISPQPPDDTSVGWLDTTTWDQWQIKTFHNNGWYTLKAIDDDEIQAQIQEILDRFSNYYLKTETYSKSEVDNIISQVQGFVVVSVLPETGAPNKIYLLGPIGAGPDKYEEWIYSNNAGVKIGDTSIDLSEYAKIIDIPVEKGIGINSVKQKGTGAVAIGASSVAEGSNTVASGIYSHAEGQGTMASGNGSHAEGVTYNNIDTSASADAAHAEGAGVVVKGQAAHGEGLLNVAGRTQEEAVAALADFPNLSGNTEQKVAKLIGFASHSEGSSTRSLGTSSHAEGNSTQALVNATHAEGDSTIASGEAAHSEGYITTSSGNQAHAEGYYTEATANQSHAEGKHTKATSENAHAEGNYTTASGNASHTEGYYTVANNNVEHAEGQYNVSIADVTRHTVGIGNSSTRKNAHTITTDGKHYIPGVGGYTGEENTEALLNSRQDLANVINSKVEKVFIATEGSTSFVDIKAAIDAGREVICLTTAGYAYLIEKTSSYITFEALPSSNYTGASRKITVDNNNNWNPSYIGFDLEYDTTSKKIKKSYNFSSYIDVVTAAKIVEDGGATANLISQSDFNAIFN